MRRRRREPIDSTAAHVSRPMRMSAASMTAHLAAAMGKKKRERVINTEMLACVGADLQACLDAMQRSHASTTQTTHTDSLNDTTSTSSEVHTTS